MVSVAVVAAAVARVTYTGLVPDGTDCVQEPKVPPEITPVAKVYVRSPEGTAGADVARWYR
jgi:hypothetical protein